ncbi:MAG TPA: PKD domain-containing protein [Methanothermococcus okinawensis]|uniref:PKD domain-containing protein n=1 Tax=Methanothermococcus okinawensis TaxID=155863 RepID=A0A832ZZU9_9EURY|nr:PKD domain-containing protein [Methanothermococcus okinawensis]
MVWFYNLPYNNFTVATLSFKALSPGEANITLKEVGISNEEGTGTYKNVVTYPARVKVESSNESRGYFILKNFEIKKKIEGILVLIVGETPVKNISGEIVFSNVTLVGVPVPLDVNMFKRYSYSIEGDVLSFFATVSKEYENKRVFEFLKIPLLINTSSYNISLKLWVNGKPVKNITIYEERNVTEGYSGLIFYIDGEGYKEETNISLGYSKSIRLKVCNVTENLTDFSGYIFINNSLFKVLDYGLYKLSNIYQRINYSNITYNNSYLYFNISLKNGTNGTYTLLKFTISPKVNKNISSLIYLGNLSLYANTTKVSLPYKNLTVHIVKRKENNPPRLKVVLYIEDNKEVHFQALGYDPDNETLRYFWDFGDGTNSTLQNPIHVYPNYSHYLVSCKVWDSLNESDEVEFILPIVNVSPLESYSIIRGDVNTIYLNLSLKNPFEYPVGGYINFIDYQNYRPSKSQYYLELKPNETRNLLIPINITKSCDIKWNIVHYPLYKNKLTEKAELKYYQWNFKERVEVSREREEEKVYTYLNTYSRIVNISTPQIVIKIRRHYQGGYVVLKDVIAVKSLYLYLITSLCGFMIGLITVLTVYKKKKAD